MRSVIKTIAQVIAEADNRVHFHGHLFGDKFVAQAEAIAQVSEADAVLEVEVAEIADHTAGAAIKADQTLFVYGILC